MLEEKKNLNLEISPASVFGFKTAFGFTKRILTFVDIAGQGQKTK